MKLKSENVQFNITRSENGKWLVTSMTVGNEDCPLHRFWVHDTKGDALGQLSILMCDVDFKLSAQEEVENVNDSTL